jgi:hypothetical protein
MHMDRRKRQALGSVSVSIWQGVRMMSIRYTSHGCRPVRQIFQFRLRNECGSEDDQKT